MSRNDVFIIWFAMARDSGDIAQQSLLLNSALNKPGCERSK